LKGVILGDAGIGKSTFVHRFKFDKFDETI